MKRKSKATIVSLIFLFVFLANQSQVFSYAFFNYYRMDGGISSGHYHINAPITINYNGTTYYIVGAYNWAFGQWNSKSIANLTSGSLSGAKVTAYSMDDTDDEDLFGLAVVYDGTTRLGENGAPIQQNWTRANVFLNLHGIDHHNFSQAEYRAVAVHEIGHAYGLAHYQGKPSVMDDMDWEWPGYLTNQWYTPQDDDIEGLEVLYGY